MSEVLTLPLPPAWHGIEPKLFTIEDLEHLPTDLPSGPVKYELHHGRLITMPPPGDIHGAAQLNLGTALKSQGEWQGHGKARTEVSVIFARNPDDLRVPDALFIGNDRLPLCLSKEGYLETKPHLVVEVRSKNDTQAAMRRKAEEYLDAGVVVVWVVDPIQQNVVEYRAGGATRTYAQGETLTVEDIIPGFSMLVSLALQQ